eukprot:m.182615 g.182615  ORF g.182615 m.182615 type:complete len:176 (+) comp16889_c0_seq12:213-740(+)
MSPHMLASNFMRLQNGMMPLHSLCSFRGSKHELLSQLLKAGANVNAVSKDGETPLTRAFGSNQLLTIECLAAAGANLHSGMTIRSLSSTARLAPTALECFKAAHLTWIKAVVWDLTTHFPMAEDASYACQQDSQALVQLAVLGPLEPLLEDINLHLLKWAYVLSTQTALRAVERA